MYMFVVLVYSVHYILSSLCDVHLATLTEYVEYPDILSPNLSFYRMTNLETFLFCGPTLGLLGQHSDHTPVVCLVVFRKSVYFRLVL